MCKTTPTILTTTTQVRYANHVGYLPATLTERIHYVFFESQTNAAKDPLVIFLNGGPGCSSLASLFHENGPFIFMPGEQHLTINKNAWNKRANLLYL